MNREPAFSFVFFGSSRLSVIVLDELGRAGLAPAGVVTTPDKPQGRSLALTPNVVKQWAAQKGVPVLDPVRLDSDFADTVRAFAADVFVVASYGRIIPAGILDIPRRKTLNIHPSLLPRYRGPSPLPTAMLDDAKNTGVSIMRLDAEMDHGPIVSQKAVTVAEWPTYEEFEEMMAREGARLLAQTLPGWIAGTVAEQEQDHAAATYTRKIAKEDGQLDLTADAYLNFRKIQAYHEWPQAYFFIEHKGRKIRVKATSASFKDGKLSILKVVPEGGRKMPYADFMRGYGASA